MPLLTIERIWDSVEIVLVLEPLLERTIAETAAPVRDEIQSRATDGQ